MDFGKMGEMLARVRQMSETADEQLRKLSVEGSAGGGAVRVRLSGKKECLGVTLDASVLSAIASGSADDVQMLEDLLRAAFNDAGRKADQMASANLSGMMGGLGLPEGLL